MLPLMWRKSVRGARVSKHFPKRRSAADDLKSLREFVQKKGKGWASINNNFKPITRCYRDYYKVVAAPYKHIETARLGEDCSKLMYALYLRKIATLSYIKELRKEYKDTLGCCPYCGIPGTLTLDHYLPGSAITFPEYALLSENLVPACGDCQGTKGKSYAQKSHNFTFTSRRRMARASVRGAKPSVLVVRASVSRKVLRILHPYIDVFYEYPALAIARCTTQGYKVLVQGPFDKWQRKCIEHHVRKLGVSDRAATAIKLYREAFVRSLFVEGVRTEEAIRLRLPGLMEGALGRAAKYENAIEVAYVRSLEYDAELVKDLLDRILTAPKVNRVISRAYRK
jgi:5-methylcytosine-specific restriction endonuclease McrA